MPNYLRWFIVLSIIFSMTSCSMKSPSAKRLQEKGGNQLRIMSYNVNWGDNNFPITAPQKTSNTINSINADIVLLQEVTPFWQTYFKKHLSALYPYQLVKYDNNAGGLEVLSKFPISTEEYRYTKIGWHPGWILKANTPYGVIQVANLHLTPPLISKKKPYFALGPYFHTPIIRKKEISYYYQFIQPNIPTVIAGDFNEGSNGWVTQFLNQHGFSDAKLKMGQQNTWYWNLGLISLQRKLDHIFHNQSFIETRAQVLHEGASDHYPLVVDLKRVY